jgi:GTPase SAR1 family protein
MSSSAATFDHLAKVLILGDSAVGKSSILLQFCEEVFPENHVATIGLDFKMKIVE